MDMLNYCDEQSTMLSSMNPAMDFPRTPQFLDVNADLNSFFPRSGLTPRTGMTPLGQEPFANDMAQYISWNNAPDMFSDQGSYFPQQPPVQEAAVVESPEDTIMSPVSEVSEAPAKPKRGRPRKSRAKKQLSEEQEQDKRQKFLERNRQAASKCRERRKDWISKQDERMRIEQLKNAQLRAEYEILSQEVHNLLGVIHKHTDAGCQSDHLKAFLMSESSRYLASLVEPARKAPEELISMAGLEQNSAASTPMAEDKMSQLSPGSEDGDSGITNMGSPKKSRSIFSDEGFGDGQNTRTDSGVLVKLSENPRTLCATAIDYVGSTA